MILLLRIIVVYLVAATALQAQVPYPFMPNDCNPCKRAARPWSSIPIQTRFAMAGDCLFKVYFKKRVCAHDGCQEIKIFKATPIDPSPCLTERAEDIATMLIGDMIESNAMDFLPDSIKAGHNACWRVIRPSCWKLRSVLPPCPYWYPTEPDSIYNVIPGPYDLLPCDTTRCCVNVIYPTVNGCGDIVYNIPHAMDYVTLASTGSPSLDSANYAEWQAARKKFITMFTDSTCVGCMGPGGPTSGGGPPLPDPQCHFDCPEDVMREYWRILNERVLRR